MKERPILFSGPMVRALLDGTKTQTRRVACKGTIPPQYIAAVQYEPSRWRLFDAETPHSSRAQYTMPPCPYGKPGDRLWVREAWSAPLAYELTPPRGIPVGTPIVCAADGYGSLPHFNAGKQRPSMFMPRWASRITLEITSVRVERLQDISEADAVAEGLRFSAEARRSAGCMGIYECELPDGKTHFDSNACDLFRKLWESINGPGSWDANPWVWVVEFKRVGATCQGQQHEDN